MYKIGLIYPTEYKCYSRHNILVVEKKYLRHAQNTRIKIKANFGIFDSEHLR